MKKLHAFVTGRVQGVFFRATTRNVALKLGVTGWVRNIFDGRVEVLAEGNPDKLAQLLEFLHEGPDYAHVDKVDYKYIEDNNHFKAFRITF